MRKLLLFDIDGTLILTGGAGVRAMTRACEEIVNHPQALSGLTVAGRTDWVILRDAMRRAGRELDARLLEQLRDRYLSFLREEIQQVGHGVKGIMPGIRELLDCLQGRTDIWLGLLTGNFIEGARIKLEHFDLWKYFRCGAYGEDAMDRNALVPVAIDRARMEGLADLNISDVLVIGDTPHDVACAMAVGATAVAVATGSFTVDQLRECGAEIVFEDLSNTEGFLELLL